MPRQNQASVLPERSFLFAAILSMVSIIELMRVITVVSRGHIICALLSDGRNGPERSCTTISSRLNPCVRVNFRASNTRDLKFEHDGWPRLWTLSAPNATTSSLFVAAVQVNAETRPPADRL